MNFFLKTITLVSFLCTLLSCDDPVSSSNQNVNNTDNIDSTDNNVTTGPSITFNLDPLPVTIKRDTTYNITGKISSESAMIVQNFSGVFQTATGGYLDHLTTISGMFGVNNFYQTPLNEFVVGFSSTTPYHLTSSFRVLNSCPSGSYKLVISVKDFEHPTNGFKTIVHEIPISVK